MYFHAVKRFHLKLIHLCRSQYLRSGAALTLTIVAAYFFNRFELGKYRNKKRLLNHLTNQNPRLRKSGSLTSSPLADDPIATPSLRREATSLLPPFSNRIPGFLLRI